MSKGNKNKIYYSYSKRIIIRFLLFISTLLISLFFISSSISKNEKKLVKYSELGDIDYKVYLKNNEFYETDYLNKDMIYVTSIIDNILVNFKYSFIINEDYDINFKYDIIANIVITDEDGSNTYYNKEYFLDKSNYIELSNKKYKIDKDINIDYNYYNNISNRFKTNYGINTISNLVVSLKVYKDKDIKPLELNSISTLKLVIPLSKKSISLSTDYNNLNNTKNIEVISKNKIKNKYLFIIGIIILLFSLFNAYKIIKLLLINKSINKYDRYLKKIFKEYDRLIVTTSFLPDLSKYNVIRINTFNELIDVRDNIRLPILYYDVVPHQKCYMYIMYMTDLYLLTIKKVDIDKK